jgi:diguanylate cyclase (GGDEF)-like protein
MKVRSVLNHSYNDLRENVVGLDYRIILAGCITFVLFLGCLDYISGFEYAFTIFYVIPVLIAARFINGTAGLVVSSLSTLVWFISNTLSGQTYPSLLAGAWDAAVRFGFLVIISILVSSQQKVIERERSLSNTDFTTGILNSRAFYHLADQEIRTARTTREPYTLAYMDVDNFKQINDRFGHATGDNLLKTVAQTMRGNLRRTDIVARMGGDEFIVMLPATVNETARKVIQKLHRTLNHEMGRHGWQVGFSMGVITFSDFSLPLEEAIRKVDQLMYTVKNSTKDAITFSVLDRE